MGSMDDDEQPRIFEISAAGIGHIRSNRPEDFEVMAEWLEIPELFELNLDFDALAQALIEHGPVDGRGVEVEATGDLSPRRAMIEW